MKTAARRGGFTLLETLAATAAVSAVLGVMLPGVSGGRLNARGTVSASNLMQIGQGSAMYGMDNGGRLFTYTWRADETYLLPNGQTVRPGNEGSAASFQNTEILQRRTGRTSGPTQIFEFQGRLVHRRYSHLVLMDYMDLPFPSPLFADPSDTNLLLWQSNPTDITANNNIPYGQGSIIPNIALLDPPSGWTSNGVRQRWAFASSYQRTTSAWNSDGFPGETTYVPVASTPHLAQSYSSTGETDSSFLSDGRNDAEVRYPSAKVHMFEEFDRRQAGSPYFGYDHAVPVKVMFDGSINVRPSDEANASWNPAQPQVEWRQKYLPIHTFPAPVSGFGETTPISQRYRWTRFGLQGVDYTPRLSLPRK